ncbi:hypothetical protein HanPI659440_Chr14g0555521 [Helianthus annuus]|nr:hypothetical protein HanPI659440_Chr14g0555521 [Helianthus annuus]
MHLNQVDPSLVCLTWNPIEINFLWAVAGTVKSAPYGEALAKRGWAQLNRLPMQGCLWKG